jgi:hypothetical protein
MYDHSVTSPSSDITRDVCSYSGVWLAIEGLLIGSGRGCASTRSATIVSTELAGNIGIDGLGARRF